MIVFVGAVRHPLNCTSYEKVEALLRETLHTVCNQTDRDFKAVVVCHQAPRIDDPAIRDHVEFVVVDFPPPSMTRSAENGNTALRLDRSTKYIIGFVAAQKYDPDYIMIFDTDDYVSPRIADYVNRNGEEKRGWYVDAGYIMDHHAARRTWPVKDFHQICGTSLIVANELLTHPSPANASPAGVVEIETAPEKKAAIVVARTSFRDRLTVESTRDEVSDAMDGVFMNYIVGSHRWAASYYGLSPLPFPGAVWNWNTGENWGGLREMTPFWRQFLVDEGGYDRCPW